MAPSYKSDVLSSMIRDELARLPRGTQVALARAVAVEPQTVTKWKKGETQPEAERWALIERFFGWDNGEIARRVVPIAAGTVSTLDLLNSLTEQVTALAGRLSRVEAQLPARAPRRGRST